MKNQIRFHCFRRHSFTRKAFLCDCQCMYIVSDVLANSIQRIVTFPLLQWSHESATMLIIFTLPPCFIRWTELNRVNGIVLGTCKRRRAPLVCSDIHFGFGERKCHKSRTKFEGQLARCDFRLLAWCAEFSLEDGPDAPEAGYSVWSLVVGKTKFYLLSASDLGWFWPEFFTLAPYFSARNPELFC